MNDQELSLDSRPNGDMSDSPHTAPASVTLSLFTNPSVLQQIGHARLQKLLNTFPHESLPGSQPFPEPESSNGTYFVELSAALASGSIPPRLKETLLSLEASTSPHNQKDLDAAIQRHIPNIAISENCALDRALELWFHAPHEFSAFQSFPLPPKERERVRTDSESSTIQPSFTAPPDPLSLGERERVRASSGSSTIQPSPDIPPYTAPSDPLFSGESERVRASSSSSILQPSDPLAPATLLLSDLVQVLLRFVILPQYAAEALALWILHTYAFHLRDVTAYIGIESPEKRCGKTTLLSILNELCHRALASSNISPPAFFRVIEDMSPTLLIDEVDTFLNSNDQLRGILNAGYKRDTAYVLRATGLHEPSVPKQTADEFHCPTSSPLPSAGRGIKGEGSELELSFSANSSSPGAIKKYSCWCPKALAKIGHFPDTLADRCIIIRMQRKTSKEQCERFRNFDPGPLKEQCARFVQKHAHQIASAKPAIPDELNDRAADIWEPLFVLADIAGGEWPGLARNAALHLSANPQETSPITSLLLDLFVILSPEKTGRIPTNTLIPHLLSFGSRPWNEGKKQTEITHAWLAKQLRPYGGHPRNIRVGDTVVKGYAFEDLLDTFRRYLPKSVINAFLAEQLALHGHLNSEKTNGQKTS